MRTDAEVLREALTLVERQDGWCQGATLRGEAGNFAYCAEGALAQAAGATWLFDVGLKLINGPSSQDPEVGQLVRLNALVLKHSGYPVKTWMSGVLSTRLLEFNDDPNTTQEDVILALKGALAEVEGC